MLGAILVFGIALRTIHLGAPALSGDEYFDTFAARSWLTSHTFHVPGREYTRGLPMILLTALSFSLLGESEWSARLPALLFGIATLPLIYVAGRMFFGRTGALIATVLLAVSPHGVDLSRYARLYALLTFLVLGCVMATYRAVEGAAEEGPRWSAERWLWYGLAAVCGMMALTLHPVIVSLATAFQAYLGCMALVSLATRDAAQARRYGAMTLITIVIAGAAFVIPALRDRLIRAALEPLPWYRPVRGENWIPFNHLGQQYGWMWYAAIPASILAIVQFRRRGLFIVLSFWLPFVFVSTVVATKHYRYVFQQLPLLWLMLGGAAQALVDGVHDAVHGGSRISSRAAHLAIVAAALLVACATGAGVVRAAAVTIRRPWQPTGAFTTGYFYDWRRLARDLATVPADGRIVSDMSYSCIYYLHRPSLHLLGAHRQLGAGDWETPDPDVSRYVIDVEQLAPVRAQHPAWIVATRGRWRQGFFRETLTKYVESTCTPVHTTTDFVTVFACP